MTDFTDDNKDVLDEMQAYTAKIEATIAITVKAINEANLGSRTEDDLLEENVTLCFEWIRSLSQED